VESKTKKQHKHHRDDDTDEVTPVIGSRVSDETEDVLDEIECCLAEVEQENEEQTRKRAEQEWYELSAMSHDMGTSYPWRHDRSCKKCYLRRKWLAQYRHLFAIEVNCCTGEEYPAEFDDE
jgi:hypothetical protein